MSLNVRPLLAALLTISFGMSGLVAPSFADEPTYRAGTKCTIVGTPGADRLVGTRRSDVICGLGGNDTINGKGGHDRVISGRGNDTVRGGSGSDVVDGGPGTDVLRGEGGRDALVGGAGADELSGGGGQDDLHGDPGDDHLDGGPEPDDLDGGAGSNTCVVGSDDEASRCVYDLAAPTVAALEQSVDQVDVSASDKPVTVRVRATDDTGVKAVSVTLLRHGGGSTFASYDSRLVDGTVRDGWWQTKIVIPQYAPSGTYGYRIGMYDRMDRWVAADDVHDLVLEVASIDDTQLPVLESLSAPEPGTVLDVRTAAAELVVTARLTDNLSGIRSAYVCALPVHEYLGGTSCPSFELVSGTVHDGTWSATVPIPQGSVTDQWKLWITLRDRANPQVPTTYFPDIEPWRPHMSPAGSGVFDVIGSEPPEPTRDPEVTSVELTPTTVDTLSRSATVSATVTVDDPDAVMTGGEFALQQIRPGGYTEVAYSAWLRKGTDGLWRADVVLAQGAPPGQYQARVAVFGDRNGGNIHYLDAFVTVVDSQTSSPRPPRA
jgi:hypothetical protein